MKNKSKQNKTLKFITQSAIIAAAYAALTFIFAFCSSGVIQVRVAEALCVLPYFTPAAVPGVTLGCLVANLITGAMPWDIVFGTAATLIGAVLSYVLRRYKYLTPLPPIIANTIIVPQILKKVYAAPEAVPFLMFTVGVGEVISVGILGTVLLLALEKHADIIFKL